MKTAFIKQDSIGKVLTFQFARTRAQTQTIRIKLEVDSRPPEGAVHETKMIDFPYPCAVTVHDLPSLFAGKCNALLCRNYVKERDYFDLLWYLRRNTPMNLILLQNGLRQIGPWQGTQIRIDMPWVMQHLKQVVEKTDFALVISDVKRFLKPIEARGLEHWGSQYFLDQIAKYETHIQLQ